MALFNYIQTFYVDPAAVNGATTVKLTGIELFFKSKPTRTNNKSGINSPGVVLFICGTKADGSPDPTSVFAGSTIKVPYDSVQSLSDASVATVFAFPSKVSLPVGNYYGIGIKFEDPGYELWYCKQGDRILGTNTPSPGATGKNDGSLFQHTNTDTLKQLSGTDIKFRVNIAKYELSGTTTVTLIPYDYEFMTFRNRSGRFINGELVYQEVTAQTGTVLANASSFDLIGTSTSFGSSALVNNFIVITDGSTFDIRRVSSVENTTLITLSSKPSFTNAAATWYIPPVGKVYYTDYVANQIFLTDSTANSTVKFAVDKLIHGEHSNAVANIATIFDYSVDQFKPEVSVVTPVNFSSNVKYAFSYSSGGNYYVNNSLIDTMYLNKINEIDKYDGFIMSRSNEVTYPDYLYANTTTKKSGYITVEFSSTRSGVNLFETPSIDQQKIDIFGLQNEINNTAANEHTNSGAAKSKYISNKVNFANGRFAEDMKVFLTAYKPAGTDIKVYSKIHNSNDPEAFDDKSWTLMSIEQGAGTFSSAVNKKDYLDLSFGLPQYPVSSSTLAGFAATVASNTTVTTTADQSTAVKVNDLIKIYNPGVQLNYIVSAVASVNSSAIELADPIPAAGGVNNNVIGSGFKIDLLSPKNTAFNNILSDNVSRYFSTSMIQYDTFDTFSIKIVMLSNSTFVVPRVQDLRAIGVSA